MLVDHLVPDSKESRIADAVMASPGAAGNVLIVGHPYVDVWQAIRPAVLGIDAVAGGSPRHRTGRPAS